MRRRWTVWATCSLLALVFGLPSFAEAQFGVYLLGSGGHLSGVNVGYGTPANARGSFTAWGGTLGLYSDFLNLGPVKFGTDIRGFMEHSSNAGPNKNQLRGVLLGPRLALKLPAVPVKPYVQAEIGAGSTNYGVNASRTGSFAYQVQFGGDFTVVPHVDVRAEYGVGQLRSVFGGSNNQSMQQFSAGVAARF